MILRGAYRVHDSAYKRKKGSGVDISRLRHVLRVDEEECTVDAEPLVTMEQLVAATLRHGLVPKVRNISECYKCCIQPEALPAIGLRRPNSHRGGGGRWCPSSRPLQLVR